MSLHITIYCCGGCAFLCECCETGAGYGTGAGIFLPDAFLLDQLQGPVELPQQDQSGQRVHGDQHWRMQDLKKGGVVVEGDHQKGEGAGGGCGPSHAKRGNVNSVC